MALTPEDVVNKRFQPTKFREGYDQDEVDDFLDEVVVELRRLNQENEELRQRLIASDSRINELQRSQGSAQSAPSESFSQPEPVSQPEAPVEAPAPQFAAQPVAASYAAPDTSVDPNNTNNLLQLARRLHEEHVREGVEKRDALIAEGHEEATRVIQEAEAAQRAAAAEAEVAQRAAAAEAEAAQRAQLATIEQERQQLEQERQQLEGKVEELRNFERDYRLKLKSYIEGQLRELDSTNAIGNSNGSSAAYASPNAANFTGFAGTN
ncbi:DivIVA domain-containing protein [Conyzicola sp.]|uniref:DivIVA domain-containing protein n=1 Tax=Conyzicola sp. TaxID=1969404 RepID=UPI003988EF37